MKRFLSLFLLLPLLSRAEPVIRVSVPADGVHDPRDLGGRILVPFESAFYLDSFRKRLGIDDVARPSALADWKLADFDTGTLYRFRDVVGRHGPGTNAPAALAAARELVDALAPALPPGVAPSVELLDRPVERHGGTPCVQDPEAALSADDDPECAAAAGVCAAFPSTLPPRVLFPALRRAALPAAEAALAAAFPDRKSPVPVALHGDSGNRYRPRGAALVAGPLAAAEADAAAAALAAAFAPGAFDLPEGVGAPRVARLSVPVLEDGSPAPPDAWTGCGRAFDAMENESRLAWLPEGAAPPGAGAHLLLAVPVSFGFPRPDADEFALEPLARLAVRADWCAPGAEPVRAFVPRTGGVVFVPLAPDAARDEAAAARAQARAAALEESFPDGIGAVRATIRELPAGDSAAILAAVRDALFDAVSLDESLFFREGFDPGGGEAWILRAVLAAEARAAGRAAAPPGLDEAFPPFADRLLAALREGDGAAFAALFDGAAAPAAPDPAALAALAAHPFLAPFAATTNAPPETEARPLDADARAALLALLPGLAPRIDRVFLACLRIPPESEAPGVPGADPGMIAVLPCVLGNGGPRLLPASAWTFRRSPAPAGVPGWRNVLVDLDAPPALRSPATDAFAAELLRVARIAATNEAAALRAAESLVPPAEPAAEPSALRILVRELSSAAAAGPVEFRFEPVTVDARGPGHLLDNFERSPAGLALDDGRGGVVRPFTDPDPPLAARTPGVWLRVLVCAPDPDGGDGAAPVSALFAILGDNGVRLHLPSASRGHRHAAGHECPPSSYRAFAERRRAEALDVDAPAIRAFKRPFRTAAAALGPGRLATVSFSFAPGPIPADFRREWGLPEDDGDPGAADESMEDFLNRIHHRDTDRIVFTARSGLASELDTTVPQPEIDLGPGETVEFLAATDENGDTASVEVRYPPDDPDRTPPLYPAVRLAVSSNLRKADGLGHGQTRFPDIYVKPSDSIRFSRSEDYSLNVRTLDGPPDFVFVRSDSTTNSILLRGAWPRGPDEAANRALLEAFLADPAGTVRTADPAVLHPFQIRLSIPDSSVP